MTNQPRSEEASHQHKPSNNAQSHDQVGRGGRLPEHHHGPVRSGGMRHRLFAAHDHYASASADTALNTSAAGTRALKLSLVALAGTAGLQMVVFALSGSVGLLADTVHNFGDALTAVPLGIAFVLGRRVATRRYTYGYGRAEDLAGIVIVLVMGLSAAMAAWAAVSRLLHPQQVHNIGWVVVAGSIGFAGNELVAVYRMRVGRRIGSAALVADGRHARTDGITSLAVVGGALGVVAGWQSADAFVGVAIAATILAVLRSAAADIFRRLMDSVDAGLVDEVVRSIAAVPGVQAVDAVRIRWVGHKLRAEIEIASDPELSLTEAHAIAEAGHHRLLHDVRRLAQATIHVSPYARDGRDHHATTAHHFPTSRLDRGSSSTRGCASGERPPIAARAFQRKQVQ
jgi:cation diffusion facilitator family transporter